MKKVLSTAGVALLATLALSACGGDDTHGEPSRPSPSPRVTASQEPSSEPTRSPSAPEDISEDALDSAFVSSIKEYIPSLKDQKADELVGKARGFCDDFAASPTKETAKSFHQDLKRSYHLQDFDGGVFMGASVATYCSEYNEQLKTAVEGL